MAMKMLSRGKPQAPTAAPARQALGTKPSANAPLGRSERHFLMIASHKNAAATKKASVNFDKDMSKNFGDIAMDNIFAANVRGPNRITSNITQDYVSQGLNEKGLNMHFSRKMSQDYQFEDWNVRTLAYA